MLLTCWAGALVQEKMDCLSSVAERVLLVPIGLDALGADASDVLRVGAMLAVLVPTVACCVSSTSRRFVGGSPLKRVIVPSIPQIRPIREPVRRVIMPRWVMRKATWCLRQGQRDRAETARFAPSKISQRLNHGAP